MNPELQVNLFDMATIFLMRFYAGIFSVNLDTASVWMLTAILSYVAYRLFKRYAFVPLPLVYAWERFKHSLKSTQQLRLEAIERGKAMSDQDRVLHLKKIMADAITNGLEDGIHAGNVTREEAEAMYADLANRLNLPDLLPKKIVADAPPAEKQEPVIVPAQPKKEEPQPAKAVDEIVAGAIKAVEESQKIVRLPDQKKGNVSSIFKKVS